MRNMKTILILGIWVAILPYLGFPHTWKNVLFSLSGLVLIYIGFMKYREYQKATRDDFDNFKENKDFFNKNNNSSDYIEDSFN